MENKNNISNEFGEDKIAFRKPHLPVRYWKLPNSIENRKGFPSWVINLIQNGSLRYSWRFQIWGFENLSARPKDYLIFDSIGNIFFVKENEFDYYFEIVKEDGE